MFLTKQYYSNCLSPLNKSLFKGLLGEQPFLPSTVWCIQTCFRNTPQQYNKKSVKIDQGLDFLKVWAGEIEENSEND